MDEPVATLIAGLRAALDRDLVPHLEAIARVRAALDAYEAVVRRRTELGLVQKAADALGIQVESAVDDGAERNQLEEAIRGCLRSSPDHRLRKRRTRRSRRRRVPRSHRRRPWLPGSLRKTPPARPSLTANDERLRQRNVLRALVSRVGKPRSLDTDVDMIDEMDALDEISAGEERSRWEKLSRDQQRLWLSHLVARARNLKERSALNASIKGRLRDVIVRFPEFAASARPGHVNGMKLDHEPEHGSWERDVDATYEELLGEVEERRSAIEDDERPSTRKSRPSKVTEPSPEPIDWKYRDRAATMRVVMFGGSRREDARANIETALGIGTLEWAEGDKPRRVDALAAAVARGSFDVFLLLRSFVHHKDADKLIAAAKSAGTPFAIVESGYGVDAIRAAIESALDAHEQRARDSA